jgi:hypothetical protein
MSRVTTKIAAAVVLIGLGMCVMAFSRSFEIKIVGRLGQSVTFQFFTNANRPFQANITRFAIEERTSRGEWAWVWALTGEQRLTEITYGKRYGGLKELQAPRPLRPGVTYRLSAKDSPRGGPSGFGGRCFRFNEDGTVIVSSCVE